MKHNWEYKKLGEVCLLEFGTRIVAKTTEPGPYYVYGGGGATFKTKDFNREDCTIISRFAMSPECVREVRGKFYLNDSGLSVKSIDNRLKQSFINKFLWCNQNKIYQLGRGAAQRNLNTKAFTQLLIPLPSEEIQERIVKELDEINGMIEDRKEQLRLLDQLAQSIFYEMFGDPITNPKGWEVKKFGVIGEFQRGGGFLKSDFISDGVPCIHYGQIHMKFGPIVKGNLTFISSGIAKKSKFAKFNDVIIAITSEDLDGSCKSIAWLGNYDVAVGSHAAIFSHKQNAIFITYYMRTKAFNLDKERYAHGSKVVEIKPSDIGKIPIFLPPISLQNEFASRIELIEEQKKDIENSIKELETLLASRMDYWFN